jgi:hypothetical protein
VSWKVSATPSDSLSVLEAAVLMAQPNQLADQGEQVLRLFYTLLFLCNTA